MDRPVEQLTEFYRARGGQRCRTRSDRRIRSPFERPNRPESGVLHKDSHTGRGVTRASPRPCTAKESPSPCTSCTRAATRSSPNSPARRRRAAGSTGSRRGADDRRGMREIVEQDVQTHVTIAVVDRGDPARAQDRGHRPPHPDRREVTIMQRKPTRLDGSLGKSTGWLLKSRLVHAGLREVSGATFMRTRRRGAALRCRRRAARARGRQRDRVPVRRAGAVSSDELVGMDRHTVLLDGAQAAGSLDAAAVFAWCRRGFAATCVAFAGLALPAGPRRDHGTGACGSRHASALFSRIAREARDPGQLKSGATQDSARSGGRLTPNSVDSFFT